MRQWLLEKRVPYLERIIGLKGRTGPNGGTNVCACGFGTTIWRCRECADKSPVCVLCCKNRHKLNWFHRVEKWNGRFYQPGALWQVGVKMYVGHNGAPCPKSISALSEVHLESFLRADSGHLNTINIQDVSGKFGKKANDFLAMMSDILDRPLGSLSNTEKSILDEVSRRTGESPDQLVRRLKGAVSKQAEREAENIQADADRSTAEAETVFGDPQSIPKVVEDGDDDWEDEDDQSWTPNIPRFLPRPPPTDGAGHSFMTVVHSNGFHSLPVVWCNCGEHQNDRDLQLLDMHLYPASYDNIRTVFTFSCLDDHRYEYLESKTSHYQYHSKLQRLTCSVYPEAAPNRHAELRRVARQWRNLKYRKWFWKLSNSNGGRGSMAHFCAACPQPGINLGPDWEKEYAQNPYVR